MDQNSYTALQAICTSMQSLLGPNKRLKCYLSETAEENSILGDAMQVLNVLVERVEHPVGQLLLEAALSQQAGWGCGVTSVACLGSFWAREVRQLLQEGIPLPVVLTLFEEALRVCEGVFARLAIPLSTLHRHSAGNSGAARATTERHCLGERKWAGGTNSIADGNSNRKLVGRREVRVSSGLKSGREVPTHPAVGAGVVSAPGRARVMALSRHFGRSGSTAEEVKDPAATPPAIGQAPQLPHPSSKESLLPLLGAGLSHGREVAMRLAVRALQMQAQSSPHLAHPDPRLVLHQCVVGVGEELSTVVAGVAAVLEPEMAAAAQALQRPTRVMVVSGDATPSYTTLGLKHDVTMTSFHTQQLWEKNSAVQWMEKCAAVVKKHGLGLLAVGGTVSPLLWDHCLSVGVVVLKQLTQQQCHMICHMTGSAAVSDLTGGLEKHVGGLVKVCLMEGGWSKTRGSLRGQGGRITMTTYCTIQPLPGPLPLVSSVILCGRSHPALGCLEQQLLNCLARLAAALAEGCVLPGGGVVETACVGQLQAHWAGRGATARERASCNHPLTNEIPSSLRTSWLAGVLPHSRARVYQAVASGLRQLACTVLLNAHPGEGMYQAQSRLEEMAEAHSSGCGGQSRLEEMAEAHSSGCGGQSRLEEMAEAHSSGCGGQSRLEAGSVLDLKQGKYESWLKAYHLVRMISLAEPVT